jgi:hypothetical protein
VLALLHLSSAHVPVFDAPRDEDHQDLELRHFADEELLSRARRGGPEAVAAGAARDALDEAVAERARAVLCTCSAIGGVAEAAGTGPAPGDHSDAGAVEPAPGAGRRCSCGAPRVDQPGD